MKNKMIEFLLNNANPSIKRRIKSEILHNITQAEGAEYQRQILQEPNIKRTIACQKENGWLGNGFHGTNKNAGQFENMETCTKYLGEKAVDKDTPVLKRAMDAFITVPLDDLCYGTRGIFIDEFKTTGHGHNLIRCACIARAGYDDVIDISPQIQLSLDSFKRVLEVDSVLEVSRLVKKGKSRIPVVDAIFKDWGPYAGLQLETDWKSNIRRDCDITFRALLILHYSNFLV
jgi:hypothetical protein